MAKSILKGLTRVENWDTSDLPCDSSVGYNRDPEVLINATIEVERNTVVSRRALAHGRIS